MCDAIDRVLMHVSGSAVAELKKAYADGQQIAVSIARRQIYAEPAQASASTYSFALPVGRMSRADLAKTALELSGFRLDFDPSLTESATAGGQCVGHLYVKVSRTWKVRIEAVPVNTSVTVQVQQNKTPTAGDPQLATPLSLPDNIKGWPSLDWNTTLFLDIHPAPQSPNDHYPYKLRAADLETIAGSASGCSTSGSRKVCHDEREIRRRLIENASAPMPGQRNNSSRQELKKLIERDRLSALQVVSGIEFQLVSP
jgi:hypothetical protein